MSTKMELSTLKDGGILLVNDGTLSDIVKRIEFYREQRLLTLVYRDEGLTSELFEYEVPDEMLDSVNISPDVIIYNMFKDHDPVGYKVPLIKVGELY